MLNICKAIVFGITLIGFTSSSQANVITWEDETFTGISGAASEYDFDSGYISFTPFLADSLAEISGLGSYHSHGESRTLNMDIKLDGAWTEIWSVVGILSNTMTSILTPISFSSGLVSGIRLSTDGPVGQAYHFNYDCCDNDETFPLRFTFNQVPEPAALAIFGLGLVGLGAIRRRKKII